MVLVSVPSVACFSLCFDWVDGCANLPLLQQIEALAFLRLCRVLCISSGISGSIDTGFTCSNWPFGVDGNCGCLAVCFRVGQVNNIFQVKIGLFMARVS